MATIFRVREVIKNIEVVCSNLKYRTLQIHCNNKIPLKSNNNKKFLIESQKMSFHKSDRNKSLKSNLNKSILLGVVD